MGVSTPWERAGAMLAVRRLHSSGELEDAILAGQGPAVPRQKPAVLTVLPRALLRAQRQHFDLLQGSQGPPRVHQADGCRAQEPVGPAQGGGAEPGRPGKSSTDGQGGRGALGLEENEGRNSSSCVWLPAVPALTLQGRWYRCTVATGR